LNPVPERPGSLGRARPEDDVAVLDPDTLAECPPARFDPDGRLANAEEAVGELVGRNVARNFEGYYRDPAAEADRVRHGWYWSGDLAFRDEDGVLWFAGRSGDWLRVDSENFTAAPVERILQRWTGATGVAVYPVPDPRTGDQVMAALEVPDDAAFDPVAFAGFLDSQPDLGPLWWPRYVRLVRHLPTTGTDKIDKRPLRAQRWDTTDALWAREGRDRTYRRFTPADLDRLREEFAGHGRRHLLEVPGNADVEPDPIPAPSAGGPTWEASDA
jgi:fatty-acyl-CoA synthase